jgi:hypothetical protein
MTLLEIETAARQVGESFDDLCEWRSGQDPAVILKLCELVRKQNEAIQRFSKDMAPDYLMHTTTGKAVSEALTLFKETVGEE